MTPTLARHHLHQRARGLVDVEVGVGGQRAAEEGGSEVDGDGGEPDHEETKGDTLRVVRHHLYGVNISGIIQI